MPFLVLKYILLLSLSFVLLVSLPFQGQAQSQGGNQNPKKVFRILVLNSYHRTHAWTEAINQTLQDRFSATGLRIDLHFEYMDSKRFPPETIFPLMEKLCRIKYGGGRFDLIIVSDNNALDFIKSRRPYLFPGVPIVFCGINNFTPALIDGYQKITGVAEAADIKGTIDLALRLQPETRYVVAVSDNTPTGQAHKKVFRKAAGKYAGRVEFIELFDKSVSELIAGLKNLPDKSIVLELSFYRDRDGKSFTVSEQAALVTENSRFPVYTAWDFFLGLNLMGGVMVSGSSQGSAAAGLAIRILKGEDPNKIPVITGNVNEAMLDYNVVRKFKINPDRIPSGTIIVNQPQSFYDQNKRMVWQVGVAFLVLIILVTLLLLNIMKRRRVEAEVKNLNHSLEQKIVKRTEKLTKREAELASIFRASPTGVGVLKERVFKRVNHRFCEIVGYSEIELLGENVRMLYPSAAEYERVGTIFYRQLMESGISTVETRFIHKNGYKIDILGSMSSLDPGNPELGSTFVVVDLTKLKDTERKLYESEGRFQAMMESMSDPVYICTADFRIEYLNPAMVRLLGRDAVNEKCFQAIHGLQERCSWCRNDSGIKNEYFDQEILRPQNNRYYHVTQSPIINADGTISAMVIFRDIAHIRRLENQLLKVQKLESIGTLACGVAHDFNNILTAIYNYADVVMSSLPESSKLWRDVYEIQQSSEQATAITRQLLTFSRNQKITPQMLNFNTVVVEMGPMLGSLLGGDFKLETSLDVNTGVIVADPAQLHQIMVNLVVNARDAILMNPEAKNKVVRISTSEVLLDDDFNLFHEGSSPGPHLLIEVVDAGCGMSTEVLEHIFEPFYTTKDVGSGTGLGLATVYGIVKQNSGSIYVESEPGVGTTFKIYWPLSSASAGEGEVLPDRDVSAGRGTETILFAEDDDRIREIIGRKLREEGYQVITAADGREALAKAESHEGEISLLFTDVVMPAIGGQELGEKLRQLYPKIKIIFVSGYLDDRIHQEILEQGNFINKPYSFKKIVALICQTLDDKPA